MRALLFELRPVAFDSAGIDTLLAQLAETAAAQSNARFDTHIALDGAELDPDTKLALYRIAQESLTNAARHSNAATISLRGWVDSSGLIVEVRDDGAGFDDAIAPTGHGLLNMRERAALAGIALRVETRIGAGTLVRAVQPTRHPAGQVVAVP